MKSSAIPVSAPARSRASVIEKQLGSAVLQGKKIIFARQGASEICGYLVGLDEKTFFVMEVQARRIDSSQLVHTYLINREFSPWQRITSDLLDQESDLAQERVNKVLIPFREWMQEYLFPPKSR